MTALDPFFPDSFVYTLDQKSFRDFIQTREMAFTMFFDQRDKDSYCVSKMFSQASKKAFRNDSAFVCVDCMLNDGLCKREGVDKTPMLQLYSYGNRVGALRYTPNLNADLIKSFYENAPEITGSSNTYNSELGYEDPAPQTKSQTKKK